MFCKWCGGSIASPDTKCKRCGKEVPALSDCGGFYDLVPNAKKPHEFQMGALVPPQKSENPSHKSEMAIEVDPKINKKRHQKPLWGLKVLTVAGFATIILMLTITISKVNHYSSEVNGLRNDLRTISEKQDALTEATELNPVLAEQNVSFTVKITNKDTISEIDLDLGDYTDTAVVSYGLVEQTDVVNSISYKLKEADTAVLLTIDRNDEYRTKNLSVSYVIDGIGYGFSEAPETCKWQCRFSEDAEWEEPPEDVFINTEPMGRTELSVMETALQIWTNKYEGELELRCEISRINEQGGSLTIVIEGIRFYE